jgi:hypothetical protein
MGVTNSELVSKNYEAIQRSGEFFSVAAHVHVVTSKLQLMASTAILWFRSRLKAKLSFSFTTTKMKVITDKLVHKVITEDL